MCRYTQASRQSTCPVSTLLFKTEKNQHRKNKHTSHIWYILTNCMIRICAVQPVALVSTFKNSNREICGFWWLNQHDYLPHRHSKAWKRQSKISARGSNSKTDIKRNCSVGKLIFKSNGSLKCRYIISISSISLYAHKRLQEITTLCGLW